MIEIRMHGRGGQGAVVASRILAAAFSAEGSFVQSFPEFGVERRGAPVKAYIRVNNAPIYIHTAIYEPDIIVVLDSSLFYSEDITKGLKTPNGIIIYNGTSKKFAQMYNNYKVAYCDANAIARELKLGSFITPIVNTAILGSFVKVTNLVKLESVLNAIGAEVPIKTDVNKKAAELAYAKTVVC